MMTREQAQEIWEYIKGTKVAMITSHDQGVLRARPMRHEQHDFDGMLWFFTSKASDKVGEFTEDDRVCVTYANPSKATYVSLSGFVRFTDDKALIDKFWNAEAAAWFPDGKDDPNVALMGVQVTQAEVWDSESNGMVKLFEIAKANLTGEKPDMHDNRKYG
ncbi:pyridoxamine 5'-phosphate oxidase family protein [Kordiimonas aestuarii]|uniref:pyridoxamine 5'-phosphate oxidase family protein n=1 Tax=Kordiimonas aestuarii TaxID=1005925 RepID=UPI0021D0A664|nr:pyridoxamine 5'-phosphate oxidase family protein [Kordiimonas aestuarii]